MRRHILTATAVFALLGIATPSSAYRDYFTSEQKAKLASIQNVLVRAVALTDRGKLDPGPIRDLVVDRLGRLNYTVVTDPSEPYDVVFRVKCEQYKTWEGTAQHGGDADLPDAPARLWKGPACQLTYVLGRMRIDWQKEVRAEFEDPITTAAAAGAEDPGAYAISHLRDVLAQYDFPLFIAAEWGHGERLLAILDRPGVPASRKLRAISLLGEMQADEALPKLREALKDKRLAKEAAVAIGSLGRDGIPLLADLLKHSKDPELQAAAAKGLGTVGGIAGDPRVVPPLLEMLDPPGGIAMNVQIEVVWALGKMPDKVSIEPLYALHRKVLKRYEPENKQLRELKEALNWSIKQTDVTHDVGG